jgi:peroxiredoxin
MRIIKPLALASGAIMIWSAWGLAQSDRPRLRPLDEQSTKATTGLEVGTHIPDFEIMDLNRQRQTFDSLKGPRGLVLVFSRSADWCPFCKSQLADLNQQLDTFRKVGLTVAGLTYDSPEILRSFAARVGIKYPLLSDPESKMIRAFGILNPNGERGSRYEGIPFPGIYIINERGIVIAKYFDDDYREPISAGSILTRAFGASGVMRTGIQNAQLVLVYSASDSVLVPGRRITLIIDVVPQPKMHLYAPGVQNYIPIDWQMGASKSWIAFPPTYPPSHMLSLPAINETVPVYNSRIRMVRDIAIGLESEIAPVLSSNRTVTFDGSFRYQACDDTQCYLPKTLPLRWTFKVGQLDDQRVPPELQKYK